MFSAFDVFPEVVRPDYVVIADGRGAEHGDHRFWNVRHKTRHPVSRPNTQLQEGGAEALSGYPYFPLFRRNEILPTAG